MSTSSRTPATDGAILVIDDEPDLRTLYELTLLREGYRVEAAGSVIQAREQLQARRFDAIICDMRLPDGSGLEVLHLLRALQRPEFHVPRNAAFLGVMIDDLRIQGVAEPCTL